MDKPVCAIWNPFLPIRLKLYLIPDAGNRASVVLEAVRVALCHREVVLQNRRLSVFVPP